MRILYIHQYFKTPSEPGGTRSYWISKKLIEGGHQVTMLTTSNSIKEKVQRQNIDGIEVIYVSVPYDQKMGLAQRLRSFLQFMVVSTKIAWKQKDIDLIIATSTPLTVAFPALMLKIFKRIPYIFEVRDLWPEVPIQMGALRNPILKRAARLFEKVTYRNARHVVALSPGMRVGVTKYIDEEYTSMIPNMAKVEEFWPRKRNLSFIRSLGLSDTTFKVIHFGSLGVANGASYIISAAALLKDVKDVEFVFIGGGSTENSLIEHVKSLSLTNVKFLGAFPMEQTSDIVNACDVSIVTFSDIPILYTNSPNKLFDSLSAGKPVIVNSKGWTKDLVEQEKCGFFVDPQFPDQLVDRILFLKENKVISDEMGIKARRLAEVKYDKNLLCKQFLDIVEKSSQTKSR